MCRRLRADQADPCTLLSMGAGCAGAGAISQPNKAGRTGRRITENRDGHGMAALASYIAAKVKGIGALRERREKISNNLHHTKCNEH